VRNECPSNATVRPRDSTGRSRIRARARSRAGRRGFIRLAEQRGEEREAYRPGRGALGMRAATALSELKRKCGCQCCLSAASGRASWVRPRGVLLRGLHLAFCQLESSLRHEQHASRCRRSNQGVDAELAVDRVEEKYSASVAKLISIAQMRRHCHRKHGQRPRKCRAPTRPAWRPSDEVPPQPEDERGHRCPIQGPNICAPRCRRAGLKVRQDIPAIATRLTRSAKPQRGPQAEDDAQFEPAGFRHGAGLRTPVRQTQCTRPAAGRSVTGGDCGVRRRIAPLSVDSPRWTISVMCLGG